MHLLLLHRYRAAPDAKLNDIKGLLGKMLFNGAGMEKKVRVLSGGEKGASRWQSLCSPR